MVWPFTGHLCAQPPAHQSFSHLTVGPDSQGILLKCRFELSGSGCDLRSCTSDRLSMPILLVLGPTEQHEGAAHLARVQVKVPLWGLGVRPGLVKEVWNQPRAGRMCGKGRSLAKVAPGRDEKEPSGHGLGSLLQRSDSVRA